MELEVSSSYEFEFENRVGERSWTFLLVLHGDIMWMVSRLSKQQQYFFSPSRSP